MWNTLLKKPTVNNVRLYGFRLLRSKIPLSLLLLVSYRQLKHIISLFYGTINILFRFWCFQFLFLSVLLHSSLNQTTHIVGFRENRRSIVQLHFSLKKPAVTYSGFQVVFVSQHSSQTSAVTVSNLFQQSVSFP